MSDSKAPRRDFVPATAVAVSNTLDAILLARPSVPCGLSLFVHHRAHRVAQRNALTVPLTGQTSGGCRRMAKFSLVGAMGIFVQLGVLYFLTTIRTNYLVATIVAVEAAIVHNFIWHRSFTWPDRLGSSAQTVKRAAALQLE